MDERDNKKTGDLLQKPGARRQAALKQRREAAGFKRSTVWIHRESYDAGVNAAQLGSGTVRDFPEDVVDVESWVMGYAAGITKFEQIVRKARAKKC